MIILNIRRPRRPRRPRRRRRCFFSSFLYLVFKSNGIRTHDINIKTIIHLLPIIVFLPVASFSHVFL